MRLSLLVASLVTLVSMTASAEPVNLTVEDVFMAPPSVETTAYFEVFFEIPAPVSDQLAGYQLVLGLDSPGQGVAFTGGGATVNHIPVFEPVFLDVTTTAGGLTATDFLVAGSVPIDDGDGLLRVEFTVQPDTTGTFDVSIDLDPVMGTVLADSRGDPIAFSAANGQITIAPEPSTFTWEGGAYSWNTSHWTKDGTIINQMPETGGNMVVDLAGSVVTVDADFDSALSLVIGETNSSTVEVATGFTLTVTDGITVYSGGTLAGGGTIAGDVHVSGIISPGTSSGTPPDSGAETVTVDTTSEPGGSDSPSAAGANNELMAECFYDPATGELVFDVGADIAVIGIDSAAILPGLAGSFLGEAPGRNDGTILTYCQYDFGGLPVGAGSVGKCLPAGLEAGDITFFYTPISGVSVEAPVVVAPIPEPATMTLMGLGGLAVLQKRRKR